MEEPCAPKSRGHPCPGCHSIRPRHGRCGACASDRFGSFGELGAAGSPYSGRAGVRNDLCNVESPDGSFRGWCWDLRHHRFPKGGSVAVCINECSTCGRQSPRLQGPHGSPHLQSPNIALVSRLPTIDGREFPQRHQGPLGKEKLTLIKERITFEARIGAHGS